MVQEVLAGLATAQALGMPRRRVMLITQQRSFAAACAGGSRGVAAATAEEVPVVPYGEEQKAKGKLVPVNT